MNPIRIAAIDLGTNSFHLVIVEVKSLESFTSIEEIESAKNFEILYRQREVVRINIGKNSEWNYLPEDGIDRALRVLKNFKQKIDEFGCVTHAIATSAIREALNRKEFIDSVRQNLGIEIKTISGFEEARLIYLGVLQGLNLYDKQILVIDIGGGSTELIIGKKGKLIYAASLKLGAVRLAQKFFGGGAKINNETRSLCEDYVKKLLSDNLKVFNDIGFDVVIGTSGQMHSIARLIYQNGEERNNINFPHAEKITYQQFLKASKPIFTAKSLNELTSIKNLDEKRAEIILPGSIIMKSILKKLKIEDFLISTFALREGIVIDAIEKYYKGKFSKDLERTNLSIENDPKLQNVIELAMTYNVDLVHANQVRKIALKIFDELKNIHQLGAQDRNLLEYASILHDIGYNISAKKHHKYSYYIIKNAVLVEFPDEEIEMIANIARYHRKALPKDRHKNFANLPDDKKKIVKILSAILRLSDGLEKTHNALINDLRVFRDGNMDSLIMVLFYLTHPPKNELKVATKRKKVIENLLGIKIQLRMERISYDFN